MYRVGEPVQKTLQVGLNNLTLQSITVSGVDDFAHSELSDAKEMGDIDIALSDTDTLNFLNNGDDTGLDATYSTLNDFTGILDKLSVLLAVAFNCSAYTSGDINLDGVKITVLQTDPTGANDEKLFEKIINSGFSSLGATGLQVLLINEQLQLNKKLIKGRTLRIKIESVITKTGTATYQTGVMPIVFFQSTGSVGIKRLSQSNLIAYITPTADNALNALLDKGSQEVLNKDES